MFQKNSSSHLDIPKIDNGQFRNGRWTSPFEKLAG